MTVGEVCIRGIRDVVALAPTASITQAAQLMRAQHVGDVVIVQEVLGERKPIGLVTDRDIAIEIVAERLDPDAITLGEIMTRKIETVTETTGLWEAVRRMGVCGVRRMPVVDGNGVLVGIFTLDDVLGLIADCLGELTRVVDREIEQERKDRPARTSSKAV